MSRSQLVTLFLCVVLVAAGGTYLANLHDRRQTVHNVQEETRRVTLRACQALKGVVTLFEKQEKEAGASARRLKVFQDALGLIKEC